MSGYYFKHLLYSTFIVLCFTGCFPVSKSRYFGYCETPIKQHTKVLFYFKNKPLDMDYFQRARIQFNKKGIGLLFSPEEEWNFKKVGILNPLDSQYFKKLKQQDIHHILYVDNLKSKEASLFYITPYEMERNDPYKPYPATNRNFNYESSAEAKIRFQLFSIDDNKVVFSLTTTTSLNSIAFQSEKGGQYNVNEEMRNWLPL